MIRISNNVAVSLDEVEMDFVRAQGAGGQNVNKVSTAVHLRFDVNASSLPDAYKEKLLQLKDHRITSGGVIIIKAQRYRSQEKNREDAIQRLVEIIKKAMQTQKKRKATKPTRASQKRRLDGKAKRGQQKAMRRKVDY